MKRFLLKLGCFVGLHLTLIMVVLVRYGRDFPPTKSFYASSLDKHRLLATRPSPRMIFVGGSSVALGLDTARVAAPLGYQPINMGLNLAVGLEFMLDEVLPSVRPGDVVVIAPEYHAFQRFYRTDPEYAARLIECQPSLLGILPFGAIKQLLDRGYLAHLGRILRLYTGLAKTAGILDGLLNPYNRRDAFNENGDVIAHHGVMPRRGASLRFTLSDPATAETAIHHLNRFHASCSNRSVRVFYSHPPYERTFFDLYRGEIERLEMLLKTQMTIPMLDTPEDMTFPTEDIFDLEYHLNLPGKIRRSDRLLESLRSRVRRTEN